jgi:excisionase family DNA binding protein
MRSDSPLNVKQAAEVLNLSQATIRAWLARRKLGHIRLGRAIRIPQIEIQRILSQGMIPACEERRR